MRITPERRRFEAVVDRLLELIENRAFEAGDALPTERELAETFGVSRSVLRQAFGILEDRGIIVTRRGSGRYLRETGISSGGGSRTRIELASIADVLEARTLLERQIAMLACERRTNEEATHLAKTSEVLESWDDNYAFHTALVACTHNFMLERMIREQLDLSGELQQHERYNDPEQLEIMRQEHIAIATAVVARDVEAAEELVTNHLRGTSRLLQELELSK